MNDQVCPIWETRALVRQSGARIWIVNSPRAGGGYRVQLRAKAVLGNKEELDNRTRARLTSWLVRERRLGEECPEITLETIDDMKKRRDLSVHERADMLLRYLHRETEFLGRTVSFSRAYQHDFDINFLKNPSSQKDSDESRRQRRRIRALEMMAWSEHKEGDDICFLFDCLQEKKWIVEIGAGYTTCQLTVDGYARIEELEKVAVDSSQAFVAMWFDDSMNGVYEKGIKRGIETAGYKPCRIDQQEHANKIDDQIIAEIRRSRFVVADFTHGTCCGVRGGVYYEAGFAHGLDIPVIFTCREDLITEIHFDTRQYNHILWKEDDLEEFSKALTQRICAVMGDGPLKPPDAGQLP